MKLICGLHARAQGVELARSESLVWQIRVGYNSLVREANWRLFCEPHFLLLLLLLYRDAGIPLRLATGVSVLSVAAGRYVLSAEEKDPSKSFATRRLITRGL